MIYNPLRGSAPPMTAVLVTKEEDTCIICLDSGNLTANAECACVYNYHIDCLKQCDKSQCILCKKLRVPPTIVHSSELPSPPQFVNQCLSILVVILFCVLILYWTGIVH
jgi:hypothetical protein